MHKTAFVSVIGGVLLALSATVMAESELEQRVSRLEKLLGNQALMEQMQSMEQLRMELSEIRELVENQEHQLSTLMQRQRNLYQDMDRRLHDLEAGNSNRRAVRPSPSPIAPPSSAPVTAPAAAPVVAPSQPQPGDVDGKQAYGQAFGLLKEGRYQQAIIDFRNFRVNYPNSKFRANAQYWLAEANYVSRDYQTALAEFQKIPSQYPESTKVQGAELKIGYTYYEMQDWASARTALEQVIARHPNTTVAKKAAERLQRIKREGH